MTSDDSATRDATHILVIVGDTPKDISDATLYVSKLPACSNLTAVTRNATHLNALRKAARERGLPLTPHDRAQDAIRFAQLCIVFGKSPFSEHDLTLMETQGIAIECHETKRKRARYRGF
jgi:hypothetical protein